MPPPPPAQGRIDLNDLKSRIARRLGPDKAPRYFNYLNRLLAQKVGKSEFQRFCLSILGRENIPLHNQLVLSILKNACLAKAPPPLAPPKPASKKSSQDNRGFCSSPTPAMTMPVWSNGDMLPPAARKVRSGIRYRRNKDCPSALGVEEVFVRENGRVSPCDLKRQVQHHQDGSTEQPAKRPHTDNLSSCDRRSVHSNSVVGGVAMERREEAGHGSKLNSTRGPLRAPLGIPFCSASVGGARKSLPLVSVGSSGSFSSSYDSGELCHTEELRRRMERIAEAQGLGGVTMDCANLLNNGLDAYLKQLIKSCVDLEGSRSGHNPVSHAVYKQPHQKQMNGVWPGNHIHVQGSDGFSEGLHEQKNRCLISLHDFKVAMELNPWQLGEDWPLLLEKICIHSFEQ